MSTDCGIPDYRDERAILAAHQVYRFNDNRVRIAGRDAEGERDLGRILLQDAQNIQTVAQYPWLMIPSLAVIISVLALNFAGDGLRDAADPYAQ